MTSYHVGCSVVDVNLADMTRVREMRKGKRHGFWNFHPPLPTVSRIRYIKPGFFKNEALAECDPLARIMFAGLWTEADKDGRLEDRPKRLKATIIPYDECDGNALLQQLADRGFILRYEVGGERYIAMPQWYAHQRPHHQEQSKGFPAPPKRTAKSADLQESREIVRTSREIVRLNPPLTLTENKSKRESPLQEQESPLSPATHVACATDTRFIEFWTIYPNRQGKKAAARHWRRFTTEQCDRAIAAAQAVAFAVANGYQEARYIPAGAAWLNQERFDDWFDDDGNMVVPPNYANNGNGKMQAQVDRLARLAAEVWEAE